MNYKVKKGDNLTKIAKKFNLTLDELMKLNNISKDKANNLSIGKVLKVSKSTPGYISYYTNPIMTSKVSDALEMPIPYASNYTLAKYLKDNAKAILQQLTDAGYNLGTIDGIWGKKSQAALDKAKADGWKLEQGKLINPKQKTKLSSTAEIQYTTHPMFGFNTTVNPKEVVSAVKNVKKAITPRQYTAAQNTFFDAVQAPIKRGIASITSPDVANFIMPTKEFDESHLSDELYTWLQDAIDKKWSPEERKLYFEQNPNAEVNKDWLGRIAGTNHKLSDYQKYYNTPYEGPVTKGFGETMFGEGINQAQGILGSFNIVYTKDGAYIIDDWDFNGNREFNISTPMGIIRLVAENYGSRENDAVLPTRRIKAKINYR